MEQKTGEIASTEQQPKQGESNPLQERVDRLKAENLRLKEDSRLSKELADELEKNSTLRESIKTNKIRIKEASGYTGFNWKILKSKYRVFVIVMLFIILFALSSGCH